MPAFEPLYVRLVKRRTEHFSFSDLHDQEPQKTLLRAPVSCHHFQRCLTRVITWGKKCRAFEAGWIGE